MAEHPVSTSAASRPARSAAAHLDTPPTFVRALSDAQSSANPGAGPGSGDGASQNGSVQPANLQVDGDGDGDGNAAKKRKTGPGSRGVANLTPDQLAKKRANDREAQRAIRERTKQQIENLEQRIRDLTSQQPYQELQAVLRAKEAVEAENADIKKRLASVIAVLQPILTGSQQVLDNAYSPAPPSYVSVPQSQPPNPPPSMQNASTPTSVSSPASGSVEPQHGGQQQSQWPQLPGPSPQGYMQIRTISQQRQGLLHGLDLGASGERLGLDFLLDPAASTRISRLPGRADGAQDNPQFRHVPMKHDWTGVQIQAVQAGQTYGAPTPRLEYTLAPAEAHVHVHGHGHGHDDAAGFAGGYAALPRNCAPTCPLDSLLLDFLAERRQRAAEGISAAELIGPRYPSVSSLLNPRISAFSHPLSKVFTDILATFPDISALPERVAVLYIMFLIMRWEISPCPATYDRLPEWVAPRPEQLYTTHPAWIDHLPFPRMRERLVREFGADRAGPVNCYSNGRQQPQQSPPQQQRQHQQHENGTGNKTENEGRVEHEAGVNEHLVFDNFFIPYTTTLSLNWPYEDTDTLLQSPDSDELLINPVFERHLRRIENWTLGDAFAKAFPALADTYNLKSQNG